MTGFQRDGSVDCIGLGNGPDGSVGSGVQCDVPVDSADCAVQGNGPDSSADCDGLSNRPDGSVDSGVQGGGAVDSADCGSFLCHHVHTWSYWT